MKNCMLLLAGMVLLAGIASAQYHAPLYVAGGYGSTSTAYWNGFWLLDARNQSATHLTPNDRIYTSYNVQMDVDNRRLVFAPYGTTSSTYAPYVQSGIYRVDPATQSITTVLWDPMALYGPRRLLVNQDGDYVFACYQRVGSSYTRSFLKLTSAGTTLTTILDSTKLGTTISTDSGVGRNMDTGHYLFNVHNGSTYYYAVLDVAENGTFTTFGGGSGSANYGWYGLYTNMEQDRDSGHIVGMYSRVIYQLRKGDPKRTTLYNVGYPGGYTIYTYGSNFDLQTAPSKRIIGTGYYTSTNPTIYDPAIYQIDAGSPGYPVTAVNCDPTHALHNSGLTSYKYPYAQCIYRSRNIQPLKIAPKGWQLRFSCPDHPGKYYVAAISLSGYRPAVPLPDGRRIHLVPDRFTGPSLLGHLRPFFDPGPQQLDASGEAIGSLDLSLLPAIDQPMWIAMAVLDPAAPNGIAFLPDSYVFRIP
ncbi:MAG: hypothetical protein JXQ29_17405 [Planctomycetes bacterium]|nr:hypothetical protein [Planctomycetota bacterium]